jgi:hypothetical protein
MLRQGLFDLGPSQVTVGGETRRLVQDRFIRTVQRHGKSSNEEFQRWMNEDFSNIVHQISKKKTSGGTIDRAVVRQAIVEETFGAYFTVAQAMDVGMRAFAASLSEPLSPKEKRIFASWYYLQPWLGGLTLMMLQHQFPLLKPAIIGTLNEPRSAEARGALIRLLLYYGEMTGKRREADRRAKQRALARNVRGRPAKSSASKIGTLRSRPARDERVDVLLDQLVVTRQISCQCALKARWSLTNVDALRTAHKVTLSCERCGEAKVIALTAGDISELQRVLLQ